MKKIKRDLKRAFPQAKIEKTHNGHYRIKLPNGRTVMASSTPSCPYALNNIKRDVRRTMTRNGEELC